MSGSTEVVWHTHAPGDLAEVRATDRAAWMRPRSCAGRAEIVATPDGSGGTRVLVRVPWTGGVGALGAALSVAWSVDCLRLWVDEGQSPRVSRQRWWWQFGLRWVAALGVAYHGAFGLEVGIALGVPGGALVILAVLLGLGVARRWLLALVACGAFAANVFAVAGWPTYPVLPLNWPLFNTVIFAAAAGAWIAAETAPDVHRGARLLRSRS
jgi:hypothetical protein